MGNLNREITVSCKLCNGTGNMESETGNIVPCVSCSGTGRIPMRPTGHRSPFETIFEADNDFESSEPTGISGVLFAIGIWLVEIGFSDIKNTNSDRGALVAGIVAGFAISLLVYLNIPTVLSYSLDNFSGPPIVIFLGIAIIGGIIAGATAGLLWSLFVDRRQLRSVRLGIIGGTATAFSGFILMPVIRLYGPGVLVTLLIAFLMIPIVRVIKRFSERGGPT